MNKLIMLLMAAVLIAGCTGQTNNNVTSGNGLSILSFTSDTDSQMSGQDVRLLLTVENGGGSVIDASKSLIYLMGSIGTGQWTLQDSGTTTTQLTKNLNPYDPLKELPAGKADIKWRLKAPVLEAGQTRTDTFTARAYYNYDTRVTGTIPVYSEAEEQATKQNGGTLQKSEFTTTSGPISISVRAIPDPVVTSSDTTTKETVTLEFTVENTGGGTVYKDVAITDYKVEPDLKYDDLNKVYLKVETTNQNLKVVDSTCRDGGYQDLIGGKPTTLTCDLTVEGGSAKIVYPVKITMKYGYYIDQPLSVTVVGKR